jgi:hypothetical protein
MTCLLAVSVIAAWVLREGGREVEIEASEFAFSV